MIEVYKEFETGRGLETFVVRYIYDGEYFIGRALNMPGAIGYGETLDDMYIDMFCAIMSIREVQELIP